MMTDYETSKANGQRFQVGDVVRLRSGGDKLTVVGVRDGMPISFFSGLEQQPLVIAVTSGLTGLREVKASPQCFVLADPDDDVCGQEAELDDSPGPLADLARVAAYETGATTGRGDHWRALAYERALRKIASPLSYESGREPPERTFGGLLAEAQTIARRALAEGGVLAA